MQDAVARARQQPAAVIEVVGTSASREEAAAALGELLDIDHRLAEGVLDLRVFDFLGQSHPDSGLGSWDHTQHEM
jgi:hypothetical protein